MPKRVDTNDLKKAHPKKVDKRDEDNENVFQIPSSEASNSSGAPSDATYNLEDDITPPVISPMHFSESGSETSGSLEETPHLPVMPSTSCTRALNIEFNRCLLLNIEPANNKMASLKSTRRKTKRRTRRKKLHKEVHAVGPVSPFSLHEKKQEENEESSKSDEIIQVNPINIEPEQNINPEPEAGKECEEDSKATDAGVPEIPDDTCATLSARSLDVDAEMPIELVEDGGISQNERVDLVTEPNDDIHCNL